MKEFKVIDPKGFTFGGKIMEKGQTFRTEAKSAVVTTALHFQQIKAVDSKAEDPEADAKTLAEKEKADAKAEADAKAKAEADAKKSGGK